MRVAGLEPARPCGQQILSLWCLPIPPYPHVERIADASCHQGSMLGRPSARLSAESLAGSAHARLLFHL